VGEPSELDGRKTMREGSKLRTPRSRQKPTLGDLDVVRLTQDFDCPGGRIPRGTQGTVLQVFDSGSAYQVEFEGPYEVPETVPAEILQTDVKPAQR
jgi:hypothetical protein